MPTPALRRWTAPHQQGLTRFLTICMTLGFLALLGAGITAAWVTSRNQEHAAWVAHTYEVEGTIARANIALERSEAARRGYLITGEEAYAARYREWAAGLTPNIVRFAFLTVDNPAQQARLPELNRLLTRLREERETTNALVRAGQIGAAQRAFTGERTLATIRTLRALMTKAADDERALLKIRDADQQRSLRIFYIVLGVAAVLLALVAGLSLITVLRYTRDLSVSRDTLRQLNESLEGAVQERTSELQRANEEIQRFAYIVSHDLRSPLVNVMGFTAELEAGTKVIGKLIDRVEETAPELLDRDASDAARTDLPEAIGFIRTSTAKMDRLINAILKLSREGRRVITPESLDMTALVETIRDSLAHRLDEKGAAIAIEAPLPDITGDRVALEQILSNVIENAVKYSDPSRPGRIRVRGRVEHNRAIFEVEDNGRGIDPRDHDRVFDLFRRSGRQDQPGEGIGLAHVRALTYRLGGTIDVASELGKGATFRINLPVRYTAASGITA